MKSLNEIITRTMRDRTQSELALGWLRYETLRRWTLQEVTKAHKLNLNGKNFDSLVDESIVRDRGGIMNETIENSERIKTALTDWRYSHDEIEAACGGDMALLVRSKVTARRAVIDAETAPELQKRSTRKNEI